MYNYLYMSPPKRKATGDPKEDEPRSMLEDINQELDEKWKSVLAANKEYDETHKQHQMSANKQHQNQTSKSLGDRGCSLGDTQGSRSSKCLDRHSSERLQTASRSKKTK